ncbi:MAG: 50S ribosomal protein L3 [Candidatus Pacebacteria bacterium CG_4_10_14_3_um_filter_34_15]|nr:50S ribosomal protein L3 [Candidatus Pacearchaeota archaeon]NCQ65246.1 50S ribosomal protein L3 [Candidatus Paceibacterota bacterium]OIO45027.1 MAG: 50S ribosomal protein L3 [Candidatus Pacebacteria bacterium CG1_02_43_31]PIQ81025.1 MAG: 50S ribosomal protein L3 [Candidatus Pacebacteria bacterium CG11_big_fil_rev_8_21_14_0_20_34_55]PIX81842.1 MAG: 50S ribosomal protein L3 [Candidatus Pacebacteria bacterium CG_4_10_14_3_um_filter_34_15]PJC44057.1 MAG: 50S ribosomal protein L3 [Candidatus Pac
MILDIFATKTGMTQAWTKAGKRLAVTRCKILDMPIIGKQDIEVLDKNSQIRETLTCSILEVGFGKKKLKNMSKPLRTKMEKSGFSFGVKNIRGVRASNDKMKPSVDEEFKIGDSININQVLEVGDVVKVQGISKGRGFAGGIKRHGFHGGPKTHGQSDRARAVGSIGSGTTPGRVWLGKKMPGHYGVEAKSVLNLVILHIDKENNEVWISGPIPGSMMSDIRISKVGKKKKIEIDYKASNIEIKTVVPGKEEVITEEVIA